jgi:hypothetical protein
MRAEELPEVSDRPADETGSGDVVAGVVVHARDAVEPGRHSAELGQALLQIVAVHHRG